MESIDIRPFALESISERRAEGSPPTCIVVGSRGKGKSWVTRELIHAVRDIRTGIVVSGTEEGNDFYTSFVPPVFVHNEIRLATLRNLVAHQKKKQDKKPRDDVLIVLDDCMYDASFTRDATLRGIFMNGRHWKIMLVITMQYCMDLPVSLRTNIDYVFLMRETNPAVVERLYKNFGGGFPSLASFTDALRLCTADFGCMVADNVRNTVGHFRARDPGPFRAMHPKAWQYSRRHERRSHADAARTSVARSKDGTVIRCRSSDEQRPKGPKEPKEPKEPKAIRPRASAART